jgi:hypothetical protein
MFTARFPLLALATAALLGSTPAEAARPGSLVKHTVSGAGTFEQGRSLRAEVTRATFHPIDHHFALSVSGRMGWVITGQWRRDGDEVLLAVSNMNNTPAKGSGELQLDSRGNVESLKVNGSTRGGSYKVRFKTGALVSSTSPPPPSVRLGPGVADRPMPPAAPDREEFDRSQRGRGAMKIDGDPAIYLHAAEVTLHPGGRVSIRTQGGGETFRFEGTSGSSGNRAALDLVMHATSGGAGVVTGTARMDRSGRSVDELDLQGWFGSRPFQLTFRAR